MVLHDIDHLTRGELQAYLKSQKKPATGTTEVLRQRCRQVSSAGSERDDEKKMPARVSSAAPVLIDLSSDTVAVSPVTKKPPVKKPPKKAKPEKRLKRYRSSCPIPVQQRIDRAKTQRLYLVQSNTSSIPLEFVVLGSTGNVYTVTIDKMPNCTCPDHAKGNQLCKHILFCLLKVLRIPPDSPLIYQMAWLQSELDEMLQCMKVRRVGGSVLANARVRASYAHLQNSPQPPQPDDDGQGRKSLETDNDCPICFDVMEPNASNLTYCRAACGTNFHADCIRRWCQQQRGAATCPNCRQPWDHGGKKTATSPDGYTNLGRLQGQPQTRDESTYSSWYRRYGSRY